MVGACDERDGTSRSLSVSIEDYRIPRARVPLKAPLWPFGRVMARNDLSHILGHDRVDPVQTQ